MKSIIAIFSATVLFYACTGGENGYAVNADQSTKENFERSDSLPAFQAPFQASSEQKEQKQQPTPVVRIDWDKKIVKTANLNAEVKDYKQFSKSLYEKTKRFAGYVSTENESTSDRKVENTIVIKVPVDQFENAVSALLDEAVQVNEKNITSQDVTTEYVDGRSRLEAKKQVRQRYLELLKGAKNMSDIMEVQNHISTIQEDIETVNGRLNYLSNVSAMSTIQLTYFQVLNPTASDSNQNNSFFTKLKHSFSNGWYWVGELFIGLISIWPLLLLILTMTYFFRKNVKTKPINKSA